MENKNDIIHFYKKDEIVLQEGDCGNDVLMLESGELGVFKSDQLIARISQRGEILGEIRGILDIPRIATVKALTDCHLSVVYKYKGGNLADELVDYNPELAKKIIVQLTQRVINRGLGYSNPKKALLYLFQIEGFNCSGGEIKEQFYKVGEMILQEGTLGKDILILNSGKLGIYQNEKLIARVTDQNVTIGDLSNILGIPRTITIKAISDSNVKIIYKDFENIDIVDEIFKNYPDLVKKILFQLAQRLYSIN